MEHIGIDVHKNESQIEIRTETGEVRGLRIKTDRKRFAEVLGDGNKPAKILIESSTESEWVARCLEELGHTVIVADPNFGPMYATRTRRVKTDRRDAAALAEACELGAYRKAHRTSDEQRHVRARLAVREALVRTRSRYISLARALLRRDGIRVPSGEAEHFVERVKKVAMPGRLMSEVAPLLAAMRTLNQQIDYSDSVIESVVEGDEKVQRLTTAPGVGPVTAAAFVAAVDDPHRFKRAHQVEAYFGLVPSELSSGEKQRKGHITKTGDKRIRWLLVQAAWSILRQKPKAETKTLHAWVTRIAMRRGKSIAIVALARRLAGILFAMMRDETTYRAAPFEGERA